MQWRGESHDTSPKPKRTVPKVWRETFAKTDNATGTLPVPETLLSEAESSLVISGKSQPFLGPLFPHL